MENRQLITLKRQFRFGEQGFTLVKYMFFIYCFRNAGIDYPKYSEADTLKNNKDRRLKEILKFANEKVGEIFSKLNHKEADLFALSIKSFSYFSITGSGMNSALLTVESMTNKEIRDFIVNESGYSGERDDYGTPLSLVKLTQRILNPNNKEGQWSDLACYKGNYLVEVAKEYPHSPMIHGYEINFNASFLARMRLYLSGCEKYDVYETDTLTSNPIPTDDFAFVDVPHNLSLKESNKREIFLDNRFIQDIPASRTANWVFVDRLAQALNKTGRGVALILDSCLSNNIDIKERKAFIDRNMVEGVIRLPSSIFQYFDVPVSMLVLNNCKTSTDIKFLDASEMKTQGRRFAEVDYDLVAEQYFSESVIRVALEDVQSNGYSLNTKQYTNAKDIVIRNPELLENVVDDIFRGLQISASEIDELSSSEEGNQYKLISVGDLQDGSFYLEKLQKIVSPKKYDRYLIKEGDILLSGKSTRIKSSIVDSIGDEKILATGSLIVIRCDKEKVNPVYLKTFFDSVTGLKLLESIQTGSAIISINVTALYKLPYPKVNKALQDKVATTFLIQLDQLKLAKQKISKLEESISTIFDSIVEE